MQLIEVCKERLPLRVCPSPSVSSAIFHRNASSSTLPWPLSDHPKYHLTSLGVLGLRGVLGLVLSLVGSKPAGGNLVFGLLVAVRDQAVEETARSSLGVFVASLGFLDLAVEVAGGLVIDIFVLVDVCWVFVSQLEY